MDTITFSRLATPAGIAAAALGVPADLYHFTIESRASASGTFLFAAHGVGLVTAMLLATVVLLGVGLRLAPVLGRPGRVALATAYVGTLLVLCNIATEAWALPLAPEVLDNPSGYYLAVIVGSFALFAAGWFGVALAAGRHDLVSPPVVLTLCLGALYGFTPFPGSYTLLLLGIAATGLSMNRVTRPAAEPEAALA